MAVETLILSERQLCELEMLLNGSYAPLTTYLNQADYRSVVDNLQLSNGEFFPIPIVLDVPRSKIAGLKPGDRLTLMNPENLPLAHLTLSEIYQPDLEEECNKVLGTNDTNHPYVKHLLRPDLVRDPTLYLSGELVQVNGFQHSDFHRYRFTPAQAKEIIRRKGWKKVVGFQTRNPMHRSHYEVTRQVMSDLCTGNNRKAVSSPSSLSSAPSPQSDDARQPVSPMTPTPSSDVGLLLTPTVGVTQECDIDYFTRVKCYIALIERYPRRSAQLCLLPLAMRMAGPREALLHAVIRRNYGCTHFIIGRDHAGPSYKPSDPSKSSFYGPYEAHELAVKYEERLGIRIVLMRENVYLANRGCYVPIDQVQPEDRPQQISGTRFRDMLVKGEPIPEWYSFPEIIDILRQHVRTPGEQGFCVYFVGLSGSGKTTAVKHLKNRLMEHDLHKRQITVLDADIVRQHLSRGLGFSAEDRSVNIQRIGFVASEIVKHGGICLVANIAPFEGDRAINRSRISKEGHYIEVFVDTPIDTCRHRDCKGLYEKADRGEIKLTGVNDPFEVPTNSEFAFRNVTNDDLEEMTDRIIGHLKQLQLIGS